VSAHKINAGIVPSFKPTQGELDDFYFVEREEPEEALKTLLELVKERIPKKSGFDPVDDIQVLTSMHKAMLGGGKLNTSTPISLKLFWRRLSPSIMLREHNTQWG
jgi:exodeoxyribonuclease V alpha subunit